MDFKILKKALKDLAGSIPHIRSIVIGLIVMIIIAGVLTDVATNSLNLPAYFVQLANNSSSVAGTAVTKILVGVGFVLGLISLVVILQIFKTKESSKSSKSSKKSGGSNNF